MRETVVAVTCLLSAAFYSACTPFSDGPARQNQIEHATDRPPTPSSSDEVSTMSIDVLQSCLGSLHFPQTKVEIIEHCESKLPTDTLAQLRVALAAGTYDSREELRLALSMASHNFPGWTVGVR